jgi:iron complex transport system permease protein
MSAAENNSRLPRLMLAHICLAATIAVVLTLVIPFVGGTINIREVLFSRGTHISPSTVVFWQTRLPRVLAALGCGAALSLAGVVFQAVLRNPLAEPYILGVSGGAALGKALVLVLSSMGNVTFLAFLNVGSFAGALIPLFLLHLIGRKQRCWNPEVFLLAGVVMNVFASALLLLVQYFSDFTLVRQMFAWMLGGLDIVGYAPLAFLWPCVIIGTVILTVLGRGLNVLTLGTTTAMHLGIESRRFVNVVVWIAALLTAVSVAVAGPIGFVGLVIPHIVRNLIGSDHRLLVPLSAFYGGIFLLLCDFLGWRGMEFAARGGVIRPESVAEIPVGIITACLGGPFFLILLFRQERTTGDV